MDISLLKAILEQGDKYGSALRELLADYNIPDANLSQISDEQAAEWLNKNKKEK